MKNILQRFHEKVEARTGLTIANIRDTSIEDLRSYFEQRSGKKQKIVSVYPTVGRGCVMRNFVDRDTLNKELDKELGII